MSDIYGSKMPKGGASSGANGDSLTGQAKSMGQDLKNKAEDTTNSVMQSAREHAATLTNTAKDVASAATDRVKGVMNDQKSVGADYLDNLAMAANRAAMEFDSNIPQAANYIRQAADQIDTVANAIRNRDVGDLVGEVQAFARRQPTLFFGGAVVLGFAALRFFKSSTEQSQTNGERGFSSSGLSNSGMGSSAMSGGASSGMTGGTSSGMNDDTRNRGMSGGASGGYNSPGSSQFGA